MSPSPIRMIFIWHFYHDRILSVFTDQGTLTERRLEILWKKPPRQGNRRLFLLREVQHPLPPEFISRAAKFITALCTYPPHGNPWFLWDSVLQDYREEIEEWHRQDCPNCPWDGHTIFPEEEEVPL